MSFADRLRKAREKAGLTQAQAAARWGVSKRTVEHWEKGQRLPPAEQDAITRDRLLASLTEAASPGSSNDEMRDRHPQPDAENRKDSRNEN